MRYDFGKVAIVADQMVAFGGADREMLSVLKLFPNADIYTVLYNPKGYTNVEIRNNIFTSFAQKIPFKYRFSKHLKVLNPIVYENFDLRNYDTIISVSAGPAKGVIPGVEQVHIAMVMTPPRSLWDKELNIRYNSLKYLYYPLSKILNNYLRIWDISLTPKIDYWIANSNFVAEKIEKRYKVSPKVIYPGIEEKAFQIATERERKAIIEKYKIPEEFMLVVSRLYDHKRVDWAIQSCIETKNNLVVVGDGKDKKYLKKLARGHSNIKFLGFVDSDNDVRILYGLADLLLFCGIEDFGLVPVEAMAQGTPVFAFNQGGITETVLEPICGRFFNSKEELISQLKEFQKKEYNSKQIINRAREFEERKFLNNLEQHFNKIYAKEREKLKNTSIST